jgi:hypothetical protein
MVTVGTALVATLALACLSVGVGIGYRLGLRHIREAVEAERERMSRVLGYPERRGEAHNWDSPPSRVNKARWPKRGRWYVQSGKPEGK